jgi:aspartate/methionine/tyrosine aminotransferase
MDPFALERYFAQYEFSAPYLLSPSDTEPRTLDEMINRADTECRSLWNSLTLGYTESRGLPALRDAIAAFVTASNGASAGSVTADDVLVFSCAEEAIYTVARVLVRPGDVVACIWPAYQSLYQVARAAGATIRPINARETSAAWDLNVEDIDRSIPDGTRIVVANVPHNPTGMVPSPVSWDRLRQRTQTSGAMLFADEVYRPLGAMRRSLPSSPVIEDNGRSLSLGSVSKAFGLAGVRIGWVVCRDRALLRSLEQYKDYTTICASAPAEVLALIALRCWRDLVDEQEAIIEANVSVYRQFAEDFTELVTSAPVGAGSTCFPSWVGPGTARVMAGRAVTEAGVMVLPGDTFDPTGLGTGHLDLSQRFRVGLGRRSFAEVIGRFADHLTTAYLRER